MKSSELNARLRNDVSTMIVLTENKFAVLPEFVLNKKESADSWSILECFEHLNRYARYYNTAIARRLEPGKSIVDAELKSTWLGRKSIAAMHPSNQKKQKTLKHMNPSNSKLSHTVITEFLEHQKELIALLDKSGYVDINRVKIPIEFFRLLSLPLGEALEFVVVHQQRHFLQLQRLLDKSYQSREAALVV